MKYILFIYQNPTTWQQFTDAQRHQLMEEAGVIVDGLVASGEFVGGQGLVQPSKAKSVRVRDGLPAVTDGPFAEAKEQVVGYCLLDCATEERALEIAVRWPDARYWGVELRALDGEDEA